GDGLAEPRVRLCRLVRQDQHRPRRLRPRGSSEHRPEGIPREQPDDRSPYAAFGVSRHRGYLLVRHHASRTRAGPTRRIAISGTSATVTSPTSHGQRSVGIRERRRFSVKTSLASLSGPPPVNSLTSRRKLSLAPSSRYSCAYGTTVPTICEPSTCWSRRVVKPAR